MTIVAVNGGGNTPNETREGADTTDQDFALVIYNGTAGMASTVGDADAFIDERYSFDFDGNQSIPPVGKYQAMLDQQNVDVDNDIVTLTGTVAGALPGTDSTDCDSASGDSFVFEPAVDLGEPITFTASVSGGSGLSGPEDSFVVDNDASTVSARGAMLNAWTANVCGSAPADDSLNLIGTSDALAPSDFFLI
jgi:hypothetical protein